MDSIPPLKRCTKCDEDKPLTEFHKSAANPDGYAFRCKACIRAYQIEWRAANIDEIKSKDAERNQTKARRLQQNAIARRRYARADQQAKRQSETEQRRQERKIARAAQLADPAYWEAKLQKRRALKRSDRTLAQRRRRRAERYADPSYRDQVLASQRTRQPRYQHLMVRARARHQERYDTDPAYRKAYNARINISNHKRRLLMDAGGSHTEQEWNALCAYYDHRCLCCGETKPLTKDHVLPLSLGGDNTINNLQPLCLVCNVKKHTKHIDYRPNHHELG